MCQKLTLCTTFIKVLMNARICKRLWKQWTKEGPPPSKAHSCNILLLELRGFGDKKFICQIFWKLINHLSHFSSKKISRICWFHLLKCKDFLLFFVIYESKWRDFQFLRVRPKWHLQKMSFQSPGIMKRVISCSLIHYRDHVGALKPQLSPNPETFWIRE